MIARTQTHKWTRSRTLTHVLIHPDSHSLHAFNVFIVIKVVGNCQLCI